MSQIASFLRQALLDSFSAIDEHKAVVDSVQSRVRDGTLTPEEALVEMQTTVAEKAFEANEATRHYFKSKER